MKKFGIFLLGAIAGIFGTRFCMTNEKAQEFFRNARQKGEEFLGKNDGGGAQAPAEEQK